MKFSKNLSSIFFSNDLPIPFYPSPKVAVHLIPLTAFNPGQSCDLNISLYDIQPMKTTSFNHRYNIDGLLTYSKFRNDNRSFSYTQLYRNGILEAVNSEMLWSGREEKIISITISEQPINNLHFIPIVYLARQFILYYYPFSFIKVP